MEKHLTTDNGKALPSFTIRVETPDGTMFVSVIEGDNGKPEMVTIHIGKAGKPLAAWAEALGRSMSLALRNKIELYRLLEEVSNITTDSLRILSKGTVCRSGPEGVAISIMKYLRMKNESLSKVK
jgi:ribonucleoside-diphosphate reductase alpha chain